MLPACRATRALEYGHIFSFSPLGEAAPVFADHDRDHDPNHTATTTTTTSTTTTTTATTTDERADVRTDNGVDAGADKGTNEWTNEGTNVIAYAYTDGGSGSNTSGEVISTYMAGPTVTGSE